MSNIYQINSEAAKKCRVTIPIEGLECPGSDTARVAQILSKVEGVTYYYVNSCTEMAYVEFVSSLCDPYLLLAAIQRAGFRAEEFDLR